MDESTQRIARNWTELWDHLRRLETGVQELREAVTRLERRDAKHNVTMTIRDTTAMPEPTEAVDALMGLFEKDEHLGQSR